MVGILYECLTEFEFVQVFLTLARILMPWDFADFSEGTGPCYKGEKSARETTRRDMPALGTLWWAFARFFLSNQHSVFRILEACHHYATSLQL
ncbi:MAG: hypothetical protein DWH81_01685 [Planctomycetota bacterium]|nr:MAG: hypothetical protein DWH81_01685 [Planctomycetota bacterium]